jgi:uncharacterized protein YeaO (DUF488 family)
VDIQLKRIYEPADPQDGLRILVDRVWPRGMTKAQVQVDLWLRNVAPSTALRKWFGHDRSRWEVFKRRYFAELDSQPEVLAPLIEKAAQGRVTFLFAARDLEFNQAVALTDYLLASSDKNPG